MSKNLILASLAALLSCVSFHGAHSMDLQEGTSEPKTKIIRLNKDLSINGAGRLNVMLYADKRDKWPTIFREPTSQAFERVKGYCGSIKNIELNIQLTTHPYQPRTVFTLENDQQACLRDILASGAVTSFELDDASIIQFTGQQTFPVISHLRFQLGCSNLLPMFPNLTSLELCYSEFRGPVDLQNLTSLELSDCTMSPSFTLKELVCLTQLTSLSLSSKRIDGSQRVDGLQHMSSLNSLSRLEELCVSNVGVAAIGGSTHSNLCKLNLSEPQMVVANDNDVKNIVTQNTNLTSLTLTTVSVGDATILDCVSKTRLLTLGFMMDSALSGSVLNNLYQTIAQRSVLLDKLCLCRDANVPSGDRTMLRQVREAIKLNYPTMELILG